MLSKITRNLPFISNRIPSLSAVMAGGQIKYLPEWFRSHRHNYLLENHIPWLTYDAVVFLRANIKQNSRVFEYGCGSSTLFWTDYNAQIVSIEHDSDWYQQIRLRIATNPNVELRLVPPDSLIDYPEERDISDPNDYWTDWNAFPGYTFRNYASQIDDFPNAYFDVVLVDGQARPSCIMHSYRKVKSGGMLIVDNVTQPTYLAKTSNYLKEFKRYSFRGLVPIDGAICQTDIFIAL